MQGLSPDATKALFTALFALLIALVTILPTFLKARATRSEANADRDKADAKKELVEADSLGYLLKKAQSNDDTQHQLSELERANWQLKLDKLNLDNELTLTKALLEQCKKDETRDGIT